MCATTKRRLLTVSGVTARLKRTVAERPATPSTVALHLKRLWSGLGLGLGAVGLGLGVDRLRGRRGEGKGLVCV